MKKTASTQYSVIDAIANRWSPRSFSDQQLSDEDLGSLFEAARWAASSMNEQPWRFIYAFKGEEAHDKIVDTLMEGNKPWAKNAPVLVLSLIHKFTEKNGKENGAAKHDLGLAVGNLSIQATSMGIGLHQMGGFSPIRAKELFDINEQYDVISAIAIGYFGKADDLEEPFKSREVAMRNRKSLEEIVYHGAFN